MKKSNNKYVSLLPKNYQVDLNTQTITSNKDAKYYIFFSDIHGNAKTIALIKQAYSDYGDAQLVGGGDYIDGRKDSKMVTEDLMKLATENNAVILKGNHEEMMLDFAQGGDPDRLWFYNGGKTTLRSFFGSKKINYRESQEQLRNSSFYDFYLSLPIMFETPNFIFVHGGVMPIKNYNDPNQYGKGWGVTGLSKYDEYRLWARDEYFYHQSNLGVSVQEATYFAHNKTGKTIVTGHTPTALLHGVFDDGRIMEDTPFTDCCVRPVQYKGEPARIFTDNGCHSRYPGHDGNVTVLNNKGEILVVYDHDDPQGLDWNTYKKKYGKYQA